MLLKAADGVVEVVGGALLLIVSPSTIERIARRLTAHELSEDPHDRIAQFILHTTNHLSSGATLLASVYLLSHGASKVVLVAFVLRDRLWAYPWLIGLLGVFIAYQLYVLIFVRFSWGLGVLAWLHPGREAPRTSRPAKSPDGPESRGHLEAAACFDDWALGRGTLPARGARLAGVLCGPGGQAGLGLARRRGSGARSVRLGWARLLLLPDLAVVGHLGVGHSNREAQGFEDLPACRDHPGRAHDRRNRDHDSLEVVGGDPAVRGGLGVGEVGDRRCVHRDQGGHPREHQLARRKRIVRDRCGGDVGKCVKDRCFGGHEVLLGYCGTRGC